MSNDLVYLSKACEQYFGLSERIAQRKAALGLLPIPAFRLSGTRKGPWYLKKADVCAHIKRQCEAARPENIRRRKAAIAREPQSTKLYRHFDGDGVLLYVGISLSFVTRLQQHKKSHWSDRIARVDVQTYPSREEAEQAETKAIRNEFPLYNKAKVAS